MGRPWSPSSVRLEFWEGLGGGLAVAVAARAAGAERPTACRWLSDHQKVLPSPVPDLSVPHAGLLSLREREEIGFQLAQGAVPGHWEGDLIIGSTASKSAIGTLVERRRAVT
jgi:IS30 family transposase